MTAADSPPPSLTPPAPASVPADDAHAFRTGVVYATAAFLWWGASPIYWKALGAVGADELVAHRAVWSTVLLAAILVFTRRGAEVRAVLADRRALATLGATTLLIAVNWLTYIWAMGHERVLEASLGYYINPLVNVLLGMVFLGERLRRAQVVAVAMAVVGVAVLTSEVGAVPWVALLLAATFGLYGLLRKTVKAGPEVGLAVETTLLLPFATLWLWHLGAGGQAAFPAAGPLVQGLVVLSGVITVLPLVWFTHGARRLPLATVGLLQYLAPTMQFLLAVLVYHEPFSTLRLAAFACIWLGLAVFTWDLRVRLRRSA